MGSAFHQLCPRYSGILTPLPLRLLGYLYLYVGDFCYAYIESTKFCLYNDNEHYTQILFLMDLQRILLGHCHTTVKISYVKYFQSKKSKSNMVANTK